DTLRALYTRVGHATSTDRHLGSGDATLRWEGCAWLRRLLSWHRDVAGRMIQIGGTQPLPRQLVENRVASAGVRGENVLEVEVRRRQVVTHGLPRVPGEVVDRVLLRRLRVVRAARQQAHLRVVRAGAHRTPAVLLREAVLEDRRERLRAARQN